MQWSGRTIIVSGVNTVVPSWIGGPAVEGMADRVADLRARGIVS